MQVRSPMLANEDNCRPTASLHEGDLREWFTAAELADLALPGLPGEKRGINRRAQEERWTTRAGADGGALVRPRVARGGGLEFHVSLLPPAARLELSRRGLAPAAPAGEQEIAQASSWRWYEAQPAKVKNEAERRLAIIAEVELLEAAGMTRTAAIAEIATARSVGKATLWNWLGALDGITPQDRLPALAPRRKGGGSTAEMHPDLWVIFKSDYLRASAPTLTSCYYRTEKVAEARDLSMPSERTFRRRIEREIDPAQVMLAREGEEALRRSLPSQRRSVDDLHSLEAVNIDGHKFDVFVKHPITGEPIRPMMVAIQDIRSSKLLAWRIDVSESAAVTRLAFADLFRDFGIPRHCLLDNGRAFASKWITGGAKTRFRFKIKDQDPTGLLTGLGIQIHWALPFRGQSKPVERAFRDLADTIARHPAAEGAYTGNTVLAKPENYGSRAMEWDAFRSLVADGIAMHNARRGRRGRDYAGRSFDQVFEAKLVGAQVGKAPPEVLRMALLAADQKRVNRQTGEIDLHGNRYWSEDCAALRGELVTVRFDPENLHSEIQVYAQDGSYVGSAPVIRDSGFFDTTEAKTAARMTADYRKKAKAGLEAEQLLAAAELAELQARPIRAQPIEPTVIRPVRHSQRVGGQTAAALKLRPVARPQQPDSEAHLRAERQRAMLRLVSGND